MFKNLIRAIAVGAILATSTLSGCALVSDGPTAVVEAYEYADTLEEHAFVVTSQYRIFESFAVDVLTTTQGFPRSAALEVVDVLRKADQVAFEVSNLAQSLDNPTELADKVMELVDLMNEANDTLEATGVEYDTRVSEPVNTVNVLLGE